MENIGCRVWACFFPGADGLSKIWLFEFVTAA